jgi:hypothetical protein
MTWRIQCIRARGLGPGDQSQYSTYYILSGGSCSYHCAVSDQTDQRIRWQQRQAHNERVLDCLKTVILLASIDHKQEDWGGGGGPRQLVLDCGAGRVELGRYRVLGNILVVRRKRIAHQTEGADPNTGADVDGARQGYQFTARPGGNDGTYAYGLRTARQGCLQVTGSY